MKIKILIPLTDALISKLTAAFILVTDGIDSSRELMPVEDAVVAVTVVFDVTLLSTSINTKKKQSNKIN